ncbi:MAG: hypothetical protein CEE38_06500 [Planctomycetes bacterium B3_Pla]|nr:MAG: hypothetical protein CEE38_06500 [Planctomycetes bacterium B3_Pla]
MKKQSQFAKAHIDASMSIVKTYEDTHPFGGRKNKANSKPIRASLRILPQIGVSKIIRKVVVILPESWYFGGIYKIKG